MEGNHPPKGAIMEDLIYTLEVFKIYKKWCKQFGLNPTHVKSLQLFNGKII